MDISIESNNLTQVQNEFLGLQNGQKTNFQQVQTQNQSQNQSNNLQSIQSIQFKISKDSVKSAQSLNLNDIPFTLGQLSLKSIKSKQQIEMESKQNHEIFVNLNSNIDDLFKKISSLTEEITNQLETKQLKQKPLFRIQQQKNISENISKQNVKSQHLNEDNKIKNIFFTDKQGSIDQKVNRQNTAKKYDFQAAKNKFNLDNDTFSAKKVYNPIFFQLNSRTIQQTPVNMKLFQTGKSLGCGKFGEVVQCRNLKTGFLYALKKIFKSVIQEYSMQKQLLCQLQILSQIDHPNIVKSYQAFTDDFHIFILMEYVYGAPLTKKFKSSQNQVKKIIRQVLQGIKYMHSKKIVHRDIKPQNIILTQQNVVKICDLGWAAQNEQKMNILCGTLDYISPEMVQQQQYSQKIDLWNVGVLTYELIYGQTPFKGSSKSKTFQQVKNLQLIFPPQIQVSQECKSFIRGYLRRQNQRQSIQWGLNHQFLNQYQNQNQNQTNQDVADGVQKQDVVANQMLTKDLNKLLDDFIENNQIQQQKRQFQTHQQTIEEASQLQQN